MGNIISLISVGAWLAPIVKLFWPFTLALVALGIIAIIARIREAKR